MPRSKPSKNRRFSEGPPGSPPRSGEEVLETYRSRGFASRVGYGERPAVLVVDLILGFTESESPLGSDLDDVIAATVVLLGQARAATVPVFFTTTAYDADMADGGLFPSKVPSLEVLKRGDRWTELDPRLERQADELLLEKQYASAFFGTDLISILEAQNIDTLLIAGCTTSGCIRASVVDALQNGYRAIVPAACVGDRAREPHHANLLDIDAKYGDVTSLEEVVDYLGRVSRQRGVEG